MKLGTQMHPIILGPLTMKLGALMLISLAYILGIITKCGYERERC